MSDDIVQPVNIEIEEESATDAPVTVDSVTAGSEPMSETLSVVQGEEALVEPAPVVLAEDAAMSEPMPVGKEQDSIAPVAEPASPPAVEAASDEHSAEPVTVAPTLEPQVREVIIEKEKPLTEEDKETIFKGRLQATLAGARAQKHTSYEKHLAQIVDFIRKRGILVANQELEEGLHLPDSTVTDRLNELVKRGLLVRLGDQRHARYKLKEGV